MMVRQERWASTRTGRRGRRRPLQIAGSLAAASLMVGLGTAASAGAQGAAPSSRPHAVAPRAQAVPTSLKGVCPNPVKIATDWTPEAEQGAYYQLAASGGTIDKSGKTYTAPLIDPLNNKPTGVNVQLVAGGPALGFLQTPEVLHEQSSILMGADDVDTAIADATTAPVVGIVAPFTNSLHILLWNPAKYHFKNFADIKKSGVTVLYFKGTEFVEYMAGAGILSSSQLDGSYTGSPARFVATGGGVVEQGFATAEPYMYTHETPSWNKAIAYELTSNTGYNPYSEMGETTPQNLAKYGACFKRLVPMIQQAQINFVLHPDRIINLLVQLNKAYGEIGGNYDAAVARYAVRTLLADRIVAQPSSGAFGSFDMGRVTHLIAQLKPVLSKGGQSLPASFQAGSVVTNRFIDRSIGFSAYHGPYNKTRGVIVVAGSK